MFAVVLSVLLTVILPPPDLAPIPSGLHATIRWQYGCESAAEALTLLESPGWHNWIADDCGQPHHTPTAYSMQPSGIDRYADDAKRGGFWLVGSEGNIGPTYIAPADAAEFSRQWVAQTDVTWACCGTLQHWQHPSMLGWLDAYLAAGGVVPDAWHLHVYFVGNGSQWDATLAQVDEWMQRHDVVRPVIVSETGQTNDYGAEALLEHVAAAVCDGDVSAVYWYVGDRDAYNFAPLSQLTMDGEITALGELFVALQECPAATVEPEPPTGEHEIPQPGRWRVFVPLVNG